MVKMQECVSSGCVYLHRFVVGLGRWQPGCCDNAKREEEEGGREGGMEEGGMEGSLSAKPGLSTNPLLPLSSVAITVQLKLIMDS